MTRAQAAILDAQLPYHGPEPLLTCPQISSLVFGRVEVCRQCVIQLLLQGTEVSRRTICPSLVPQRNEAIIEWSEEVDKMQEAVQMLRLCIGRIVVLCREGYGGLEGKRSMSLKGICSVVC